MRMYELLGFQHIVLYLFPALLFLVLFGLLLAYSHMRSQRNEERKSEIIERFPAGIEGRDAPFPLGLALIILGTILWVILYIWGIGVLGVKI